MLEREDHDAHNEDEVGSADNEKNDANFDEDFDYVEDDDIIEEPEEGDDEIDEDMFEPLYLGSKIIVCGAYCAIMDFKKKCRVPFATILSLLQLLQLVCPAGNKLPRSIYRIKKFFGQLGVKQTKTLYCSTCHEGIEDKCSKSSCPAREPDSFISMDISRQLKTILSRKFQGTLLYIVYFVATCIYYVF